MDYTKSIYSTGEFASLMGVNKRTLHYYSDIGLFKPEIVDKNGWYWYTPLQAIDFELLLTFRKLGLSIEEIRKFSEHPTGESFKRVLSNRMEMLDESIKRLTAEKNLLMRKEQKLELSMNAEHGKIEELYLPRRHVLLSPSIYKKGKKEAFGVISEFAHTLKGLFGVYDNFGTRISLDKLADKKLSSYDSLFAYVDEGTEGALELPSGHYLRSYSFGPWNNIWDVYEKMLLYAGERKLEPVGYSYEEGLNEMSIEKDDDYVTMILMEVV